MKRQRIDALGSALKALIAESGGAAPSFEDVYTRAGVPRATAYRIFKADFDQAISKKAEQGRITDDDSSLGDTRSAYRKLVARLANRMQVLELELEHERRGKSEKGIVIPFSPGRPRP